MGEIDYQNMEIEDCLPGRNEHHRSIPVPRGLVGAVIVDIGAAPIEDCIEGGGLVIDYRAEGSQQVRRLVLAFSEVGMWIERDLALFPSATRA